ncbi:hypothetical protein [Arcticibacter eurypsychrophilus]|uniref:hypothetical protein n=1 Tax=Arcticibacter eurypsychrophilus TaxID=1434752 RepID=UPI00084D346C|nr:hypothetical protein [Arcticibacter eurypsychrophilus]
MAHTPRITSSINDLNALRGSQIINLLKGVASRGNKIFCNNRSIGGRAFVISVSDSVETGNEFTTWRFKTYVSQFHAMYYEKWIPLENDIYFLERAYLHIYKTKQTKFEEEEYILLHCDVSEPDDAEHAKYKQSPHLHIKSAEHPLPHAHIALNNCDLNTTLSSLDNLNIALQKSIEMIDNQVLLELTNFIDQ